MTKIRIAVRLDVKNEFVVKGIQLEGLRKLGKPEAFACRYYEAGADEIIYMDVVASLYNRNSLSHIVARTSESIFVPMTVGGGIRSVADIAELLNVGADKVAINTAAVKRPAFLTEAAEIYGSQCIVTSIEAKRCGASWEAYVDNGREPTGLDAVEWARRAESLGSGEILLTSVDRDGTKTGFDTELVNRITRSVSIPVIVSGGAGKLEHLDELLAGCRVDAVSVASALHYGTITIPEIKNHLLQQNYPVRM